MSNQMHLALTICMQNVVSRWRTYARRILDWKRSNEEDGKRVLESSPVPAEATAGALRDKLYPRQTSMEVKQVEDVSELECALLRLPIPSVPLYVIMGCHLGWVSIIGQS
jgi:hypothetical protein